ncbi:DMT family transporter [Dyella tabacisoli]|uniref:DMT family transporter n=1 Tax=Dyella tabacisoli TaxID=2282381 RepID=A0A369UUR3_9GAMM|nr:DMT family transporter [Dyella tabacisoli]RDD83468.1 DMT family transporter [Dyella tabacisoli]
MHPRLFGYLCMAAAMVTVGSTVVASKAIGAELAPFTATALRFAIALCAFVPLMMLTRTPWPRPSLGDGLLLLAQAGAGSVGYTVLLVTGTQLTTGADAGILLGTLPAVAALLIVILLRERPTPRLLLAIALATIGVLVVTMASPQAGGGVQRSLLGNLLILLAVVCESVFILLNKRLRQPLPPLALATTMTGLGLAVSIVPALLEQHPTLTTVPASAYEAVIYYALIPTVGGFWLWYAGTARAGAMEASAFTAIAPIAAVILSAVVLGESINPPQMVGLALVIVAVGIVATAQWRQPAVG